MMLAAAPSALGQCQLNFGETTDDFGQPNGCGAIVTTQYVQSTSLIFGTATDIAGAAHVRIDTDFACEPVCRSTGGAVGFTENWNAQFSIAAGPGKPGVPAAVSQFSAELCFINAPPGTVLMRAFNQAGSEVGNAANSGVDTEVLSIVLGSAEIHSIVVEASVPERIGGLSVDCLTYSPPQALLSCGDAAAGDCYDANNGSPFCDDSTCCDAVCSVDPACCETAWDLSCAGQALESCGNQFCGGIGGGECIDAHGGQGCADSACCDTVCSLSPECCVVEWDSFCASQAIGVCYACGDATAGSCFAANGTPYCDDATCCDAVCALDPACCNTAWDFACAGQALQSCANTFCPGSGGCYVPNGSPGCVNESCCDTVCSSNPNCCLVSWDQLCATQAQQFCDGESCGSPTAGHCFITNGPEQPYCEDFECCSMVCLADPFCCTITWDALCVDEALAFAGCGSPAAGGCFDANGSPGCDTRDCCHLVCQTDTYCCFVTWDTVCVDQAMAACQPGSESTCPQDIDQDGVVGIPDVNTCLLNIGCEDPGPNADCEGDVNGDGHCRVDDLVNIIMHWGPCTE